MAFEMNTWWRILFFVISRLAVVLGSFSSSDVQTSQLKLQPERTNSTYYSLRGSTLIVNCTVVVGNLHASNLTWQHNGKQLLRDICQIDNTTIELKLSNTSEIDNGIYWCGPKSGKASHRVNMSLTVADLPSPPRNLRCSVVGSFEEKREYRVFWTASSYTGGLPVNYSVKLCVNDTNEEENVNGKCQLSSPPECQPKHVLSTTKDFFCVLKDWRDFVSKCEKVCSYIVSVEATNDVGHATSWRYVPFTSHLATPFPPTDFNVVTTGEDDKLRVTWSGRISWPYKDIEYTILYHVKGQMENETKVIMNRTFAVLTDLESFVEYYVYLMVRFIHEGERSAPSEIVGPIIVKTPAGEPDTPSKVLKDTSVTFPGNPALRNVTVAWKLSENVSWRGTPGQYHVTCSHISDSLRSVPGCDYYVDATSNMTVLTRLNSADRYIVYIRMYNKENKDSFTPSESYIYELKDNITQQRNEEKPSSKKIALITLSVVAVCITAVIGVYVFRKWRRGELQQVLLVVVPMRNRGIVIPAPVQGGYYYADPQPQHDYDVLIPNEHQV